MWSKTDRQLAYPQNETENNAEALQNYEHTKN